MALAVAAFGCAQVLAVENGAAGTLVGAGLVALAAPLARGRRRALLATAGARARIARARRRRHRADPGSRPPGAARRAVRLRARLPRQRRPRDAAPDRPRRRAARASGSSPTWRAPAGTSPTRSAPRCWSARACSRRARCCPGAPARADDPEQRARAARIVAEHATDTLAPFALRADKQFFFGADGTSFIAYRVVAGVALVSGDPVGDERRLPGARRGLRALRRAARLDARGARREHRAPAALARRRPARPLHRRRGGRRSGGVLARGPRDPQGAPVGHAARARRLLARRSCAAARSTTPLAARIAEIADALARRSLPRRATRWRSPARASIRRATTST